jgi:hypothetical protein
MNCCCERSSQVSWSRKYKLNYERMAFNINDTFNASDKGTMQSNRVELLFNIWYLLIEFSLDIVIYFGPIIISCNIIYISLSMRIDFTRLERHKISQNIIT